MDELLAVIKDIVRLLKREDIDSSLFEDLKKGLVDRLDSLKGKLAVVAGAMGPVAGAPPDADLPPAPDHWAKEEPTAEAGTAQPSSGAGVAVPAPEVVTPAAQNSADIDAALAKLGSGAPLADLPSVSLAEQEAALAAGAAPGGAAT